MDDIDSYEPCGIQTDLASLSIDIAEVPVWTPITRRFQGELPSELKGNPRLVTSRVPA